MTRFYEPVINDDCVISHVHPIAAANKLIRGVPYKGTIGIDGKGIGADLTTTKREHT